MINLGQNPSNLIISALWRTLAVCGLDKDCRRSKIRTSRFELHIKGLRNARCPFLTHVVQISTCSLSQIPSKPSTCAMCGEGAAGALVIKTPSGLRFWWHWSPVLQMDFRTNKHPAIPTGGLLPPCLRASRAAWGQYKFRSIRKQSERRCHCLQKSSFFYSPDQSTMLILNLCPPN